MKILHCINSLGRGGAEKTLIRLVNGSNYDHAIITILPNTPLNSELKKNILVISILPLNIHKINITTPDNFIPRFCSTLSIEQKHIDLMKLICKKIIKLPDISCSKDPTELKLLIKMSEEIYIATRNPKKRSEPEKSVYKFARGSWEKAC